MLIFEQRMFYFRLNFELVWSRKLPWLGTAAALFGHAKSLNGLRTTGRPACGALALAYHHAEAVLSFGCAGMRTFTGISDGYMLLVVPGEALEGLCRALEQTAKSNAAVQCVYDRRKSLFA